MTVTRRRTRWPNRDWVGPNAKLNKLGIMTPDHREEGFQLQREKNNSVVVMRYGTDTYYCATCSVTDPDHHYTPGYV